MNYCSALSKMWVSEDYGMLRTIRGDWIWLEKKSDTRVSNTSVHNIHKNVFKLISTCLLL